MRTAAGVFEAAASSIALTDATTGELVYQSAWGAGAREIVGVRLPPGTGIAGDVVATRRGPGRPRLPQRPALRRADRGGHRATCRARCWSSRSCAPATRSASLSAARPPRRRLLRLRATWSARTMFAELAVTALDVQPDVFTSLGEAELR